LAIIIDCHSFPSVPLPYEQAQDLRRPEICIGTDAFHTPKWLSEALISMFQRKGYSVSVNDPFAGAIVPARFVNRSDRVLSVMIEIRRDLYMDEDTGERSSNLVEVAEDIAQAIAAARNAAGMHTPDERAF
jgi:N-formylglutamate amidohydrolase